MYIYIYIYIITLQVDEGAKVWCAAYDSAPNMGNPVYFSTGTLYVYIHICTYMCIYVYIERDI